MLKNFICLCLLAATPYSKSSKCETKPLKSSSGHPMPTNVAEQLQHHRIDEREIEVAILVTSDRRQTGKLDLAVGLLRDRGYRVVATKVIGESDRDAIRNQLNLWVEQKIPVIFTLGGTGLRASDNTAKIVDSMSREKLPGFAEYYRMITYQEWSCHSKKLGHIGLSANPAAVIIRQGSHTSLVFALPGSPDAVRICLCDILLDSLPNLVYQASN
ncbi:MAG: hypothetical protein S4CHLAM102_08240 [Chlamydiia bacterium]|nr:hypothetical protein [Chlamydiia bacterium]